MDPIIYFVIMEDDINVHELLLKYMEQFPNFECKGCFETAGDTRDFLLDNPVHLLLADIQLPDMNGMDMIESLPNKPLVVFMTGHNSKKKATKGYVLDAVHYLTKPFTFNSFEEAINRVVDRVNGKPDVDKSLGHHEMFGSLGAKSRIMFGDILYIVADGNNVVFHLVNQVEVTVRETLKDVLDKLPKAHFVQVHRSYVISTWHVFKPRAKEVRLYCTDQVIPVGRQYRNALRRYFPDNPSTK
ncbi:LytR/AlgR family response regulator transcription factor [Parapedobacter sp. 10938]|uniref:LytR/AlgR family response regulator transcription factor n=1 Tax=Parapedobacter flavus TaxID=3110225 RepID=UPI002DBE6021|nr:LytTR family DNA-binding domain-containing protein [Parapedobacter sp. 10938]MEC3881901.1 LytTR family DNA-binding domain-containing protein [Parapedobacter sp. 10938]